MTPEEKTREQELDHVKHGGPDPELYAELSQPFISFDAADEALCAFLADVAQLRKKHRIPEVIIGAAAFCEPHETNPKGVGSIANRVIGYGSPSFRAQLSASLFNTFVVPVLQEAETLKGLAYGVVPARNDESSEEDPPE